MSAPAVKPDEGRRGAFLWCTECRAAMHERYYALNDRPICGKCSPAYARRIKLTDGPGAMMRVSTQGALVALAGVVALTVVGTVFALARIFLVVPIGWLIGKQMMKSLEGYSTRRYQRVAVALTYLSIMIGFTLSGAITLRHERAKEAAASAAASASHAPRTLATEDKAFEDEFGPGARAAAQDDDEDIGLGRAIVAFLLYPVLSMIHYGFMFAGMSLLALVYAHYLAWKETDGQGMHLELKGPFRVGQGPIPAQ